MKNSIEVEAALRLALEALERVNTVHDDCDILSPSLADAVGEAIDVIKEALAQPAVPQGHEQEPVAKYSDIVSDGGLDPRNTLKDGL